MSLFASFVSRNRFVTAVLAGSSLFCLPAVSSAVGFTDYYAPENWTYTELFDGVGTYFVNSSMLVMTGGDDDQASDSYFTITAAADGIFSFDWQYASEDEPGWDGGFYIHGSSLDDYFLLSDTDGEFGSESISVLAGDIIGFNIFSADGTFGPGELTITNFVGPQPVPEPATLAALGLGAAALLRRKRK